MNVHGAACEGGFLLAGAPGTGKTLQQRDMLWSLLPAVEPGSGRRVVVYDIKADLISQLHAKNVPLERIAILNPFDARGVAWDIAADVTDAELADQLAAIIVPEAKHDANPFFANAARALIGGAMRSLIVNAPGAWTLRDLYLITTNPQRLRAALESADETRDRVAMYFEPPQVLANIISTVATHMGQLESAAAAWDGRTRKLSLSEWARSGKDILVMSRHFSHVQASTAINRIMFRVLSLALLSGPEVPGRSKTWLFIDELQEAGRLPGLTSLLNDGRSKGVRCVLAFQDLDGLREAYGREAADEIVGKCANVSILRVANVGTAEWAAKRVGSAEVTEYTHSTSRSPQGTTHSRNESLRTRPVAMPEEFLNLPTSQGGCVHGWHVVPALNAIFSTVVRYPLIKNDQALDFVPLPLHPLRPWRDQDVKRLNLRTLPEGKRKKKRNTRSPLDDIDRMDF